MEKLISESAFYEAIYKLPIREKKADGENLYFLVSIADIFEMLERLPANNSEIPNSSDTISRAKAIEAINKALDRQTLLNRFVRKVAIDAIKQLPPAQPEIIRCKDCKYWNKGSCECPEHAVNCQDYYVGDIETEAEYFCGYAERREVTT